MIQPYNEHSVSYKADGRRDVKMVGDTHHPRSDRGKEKEWRVVSQRILETHFTSYGGT